MIIIDEWGRFLPVCKTFGEIPLRLKDRSGLFTPQETNDTKKNKAILTAEQAEIAEKIKRNSSIGIVNSLCISLPAATPRILRRCTSFVNLEDLS
jgi:hypothetical protein